MKIIPFLFVCLSPFFFGCSPDLEPEVNPIEHVYDFTITDNAFDDEYYPDYGTHTLRIDYPIDSDSVYLWQHSNGNLYYFPTLVLCKGMRFIDGYRRTGDPAYLHRATKYGDKMMEIGVTIDGALFYPHEFFKTVHYVDTLNPVWYSGLPQGQSLSLFMNLYYFTHDTSYLEGARAAIKSLTMLRDEHDPWVVMIDTAGYYWIEEYPTDDPPHVLNGFIFAIWGLYDYYYITRDPECLFLLRASLTTIKDHITLWRNPGGMSYYSLKTRESTWDYHRFHIGQLRRLYRMTGDQYFNDMADSFYNDFHDF